MLSTGEKVCRSSIRGRRHLTHASALDKSWPVRQVSSAIPVVLVPLPTNCLAESILSQDPHIRSGVIFGRGRFHNGVIIDPVPEFVFDPRDSNILERYKGLIW